MKGSSPTSAVDRASVDRPGARRARRVWARLRRFHWRQAGLVTLEHALIMAAFVLPMYLVMGVMIRRLGEYYGETVFFGSLPFF